MEERFVYLEREGAELMLEQPTGRSFVAGQLEHPYGRGINLEIEASDVDGLYQAVLAANAPVYLPMDEKWYRQDERLAGNSSSSSKTRMAISCVSSATWAHAPPDPERLLLCWGSLQTRAGQ